MEVLHTRRVVELVVCWQGHVEIVFVEFIGGTLEAVIALAGVPVTAVLRTAGLLSAQLTARYLSACHCIMASLVTPDSPYQSMDPNYRPPAGDLQEPNLFPELADLPPVQDDPIPQQMLEDEEVVRLDNVHKTYLLGLEGVTALRGVTLSVKKGEFVCILGTSGGGKTTLLNMVGTIDKPTKGDVWLGGVRIKSSTRDSVMANIRLHKLAFVFQSFNLISSMTALENVELPMLLLVTSK